MGKKKSTKPTSSSNDDAEVPITHDPRFSSMHNAPTFQRIPKDDRKFKIDPRFAAVLTDDRFRAVDGGAKMDKYGKKIKKKERVVEDLKAFYTVQGEEEEEEGEGEGKGKGGKVKGKGKDSKEKQQSADPRFQLRPEQEEEEEEGEEESSSGSGGESGGGSDSGSSSGSSDDDDEEEEDGKKNLSRNEVEDRLEYLNRLARGEVSDASSSSDQDSESDDDEGGSSDEQDGGEESSDDDDSNVIESRKLDDGPIPLGEATSRLAIMNCDWEHLKAVDLLGVLLSFKPEQGVVRKVTVYYSDYGVEKMAEEAKMGPGFLREREEAEKKRKEKEEEEEGSGSESEEEEGEEEEEDDDDDDDSLTHPNGQEEEDGPEQIDQEKLRAYEVQKLRYYFAVAECDNTHTATAISDEVDGLEFENSSVQIDARFVPCDVSFEGRKVRDHAERLPSNYEPPVFVTKALQQTKVDCTWDVGDEERERKLTQWHKWREMEGEGGEEEGGGGGMDDLGVYLASSSSESESEEGSEEEEEGRGKKGKGKGGKEEKRKKLRAMLLGGLVEGGEEESESEGEEEEGGGKEVTYVPGELVRNKWEKKRAAVAEEKAKEEETPFEALLRKRKEKRAAKRAAKKRGEEGGGEEEEGEEGEEDDFFAEATTGNNKKEKDKKKKKHKHADSGDEEEEQEEEDAATTLRREQELELLFAGEDKEEQLRDFDMRALQRKEKMKDKKLKGKRKRKEEKRSDAAPGQEFQLDVVDPRFAALFEGDARYGIDRQSKEFKETEAMKTILTEQSKRRRRKQEGGGEEGGEERKRQKGETKKKSNGGGGGSGGAGGGGALPQPGEKKASSLSKLVQKFSVKA